MNRESYRPHIPSSPPSGRGGLAGEQGMPDPSSQSGGANRLAIDPIMAIRLTVDAILDGRSLHVRMQGVADGQMMSRLASLLNRVHVEARRLRVTEVRVDLRHLEFMDSSCLKAFVTWLASQQDLPTESQYPIRFVFNGANHWQRKTLQALSTFAPDVTCVEA